MLLLALRLAALAGLLVFYLHLEKRTERKVVHNSRVLVLVDTSLSMGLHDTHGLGRAGRAQSARAGRGRAGRRPADRQAAGEARRRAEPLRCGSAPRGLAGQARRAGRAAGRRHKPTTTEETAEPAAEKTDWQAALLPQGAETRLGQSLRQIDQRRTGHARRRRGRVQRRRPERGHRSVSAAIAAARDAKIPIYTVGIGSDRRPANVRVSDLVAPARAYPGDSFKITGYLQSEGLADRTVTVELLSRAAGEAGKNDEGKLEGTERVTLGGRGEVVPVKFEITPADDRPPHVSAARQGAAGRQQRRRRPAGSRRRNRRSQDQGAADRQRPDARIHLSANQLQRATPAATTDKTSWSTSGCNRPAKASRKTPTRFSTSFPATPQELFEYDCIVAFDPDWKLLDLRRSRPARALGRGKGRRPDRRWPGRCRWIAGCRIRSWRKIRGLYPVEFNRRLSLVEEGRFGSTTAWPIEFTREGLEAEFLWLADSAPAQPAGLVDVSRRVRLLRRPRRQAGRHGLWPLFRSRVERGERAARSTWPDSSTAPAACSTWAAARCGGCGRWTTAYFEQFYTKLIRHVSQGRLLLGSSRGMLLVDRDRYLLGNTVVVRAQLSNVQFEPLDRPSVTLQVIRPDSTSEDLQLAADPARKGMFVGQFTALARGHLPAGDGRARQRPEQLTRRIQVKVPDLERENPERNDALLSEIAKRRPADCTTSAPMPCWARAACRRWSINWPIAPR